ncbi:hypothetical protein [Candidatus Mycoplasma mahonii]|uniref:hypothetical protein n=1 Tax=Candidatus Mycoplasma mahonii TaxID=3004105 RepID=UPI0026ED1055|nr:hypothetical protein [Candidatus Mycoplasma mahonii]WKX02399.1 hypothetical protein O3I44_03330 [Candidatus Mycoplasma mahonii]
MKVLITHQNELLLIMKLINDFGNKLLYTNDIFKWICGSKSDFFDLIITPMTKVSDVFSFASNNAFSKHYIDEIYIMIDELMDVDKINAFMMKNNELTDVLDIDINKNKLMKDIFKFEDRYINLMDVEKLLLILTKTSNKKMRILITGFPGIDLDLERSMIDIFLLSSNLSLIKWKTIERLIIDNDAEVIEIIDADKFKSWLELKTRMVLSKQDIDDFLLQKKTFNTFIIQKTLNQL